MQPTEMERRSGTEGVIEDPQVQARIECIQRRGHELAQAIEDLVAESREGMEAQRHLHRCLYWAAKAVTRNVGFLPPAKVYEQRFGERLGA